MIARDLIERELTPLKTSNTGEDALALMSEHNIRHLPIVNNEQLLGTICEDDVMDHDILEPVGSYLLSLNKAYVQEEDHLFEIIQLIAHENLTAIPVVDKKHNYLGIITQGNLLQYFAKSYSFKDTGSIVVLRMPIRDYSLAEIARIIESENAKILATFLTVDQRDEYLFVTLKISTHNLTPIISSLRRFEYDVYSSFTELEYIDTLKERYDALMSYLRV